MSSASADAQRSAAWICASVQPAARSADAMCAPHAYSVLMHVSQGKPDFVAPLAPRRNLAIFDDAFDDYGALDSLYENE